MFSPPYAARQASILLSVALWGCGSETTSEPDERAPSRPRDAGAAVVAECEEDGMTRRCTCKNGSFGRQTCSDEKLGVCGSCAEGPRDAGRPGPRVELCKAGYYTGQIEGDYKPGFAGLGLGESPLEVQFEGAEINGLPALSLTLDADTSGSVGEFSSFTVGNGCMQGLARSGQTDNPFAARLTGDLDCSTGAFVGVMEGFYTLLNLPGFDYHFKGPITAQFYANDSALRDGEWDVSEPPALNGQRAGGGTGTWNATWAAERAPDSGVDPCKDIVSTGPLDAGVRPRDGG